MAISVDPSQRELKLAISKLRLFAGDTELAPGERFTATVGSVPRPVPPPKVHITVAWTVLSVPDGTELEAGEAFLAPRGLAGTQVELTFRPDANAELRRIVRATVTATAPNDESTTRVLEVEVRVLPLRVPSVLALFRNRDFAAAPDGAALVVVPAAAPFSSLAQVKAALAELLPQLDRLAGFSRFAPFATRLRSLTGALAAHPADHVKLRRTDAITDLNQITLIQRGAFQNDVEAEDEMSSAILLGPTTSRARLFVRRGFDQRKGRLDLRVGDENIVLVSNLAAKEPTSVPDGAAVAVVEPPRGRTFDNELSSLELAPPQLLCSLTGTIVIEVNGFGRDRSPLDALLAFSDDRRSLTVESLEPITGTVATVSLADEDSTGTFDPATGVMSIDMQLRVSLGGAVPFTVPFALTTGSASQGVFTVTGAPLDRTTGAIRLVAARPFAGADAKLEIDGTLAPIP